MHNKLIHMQYTLTSIYRVHTMEECKLQIKQIDRTSTMLILNLVQHADSITVGCPFHT